MSDHVDIIFTGSRELNAMLKQLTGRQARNRHKKACLYALGSIRSAVRAIRPPMQRTGRLHRSDAVKMWTRKYGVGASLTLGNADAYYATFLELGYTRKPRQVTYWREKDVAERQRAVESLRQKGVTSAAGGWREKWRKTKEINFDQRYQEMTRLSKGSSRRTHKIQGLWFLKQFAERHETSMRARYEKELDTILRDAMK